MPGATPPGCDWCGEPASHKAELRGGRKWIGRAMFVYACPRHLHLANERVARPERRVA